MNASRDCWTGSFAGRKRRHSLHRRCLIGPFGRRHGLERVGQEHLYSGYSNFVVEDEEQVESMTKVHR